MTFNTDFILYPHTTLNPPAVQEIDKEQPGACRPDDERGSTAIVRHKNSMLLMT